MEHIEEDSFDELGGIMSIIREADAHVMVHEKAAVYHEDAMRGARELAATARQRSTTHRRLYRDTVSKFAGIFAAAHEAGEIKTGTATNQEGLPRADSSTFRVPLHPSPLSMKQGEGNPSIDGFRRESAEHRVRQWQMQASAMSVPEEEIPNTSAAFGSNQSTRSNEPFYPPPTRPPPRPPQRLPFSASCNNISPLSPFNADGTMNEFYGGGMSMRSAPPSMPAPTTYQTHAMKSRAASKKAFEILAAQTQRREDEEKRRREQGGSSEGRKSGSSGAFL